MRADEPIRRMGVFVAPADLWHQRLLPGELILRAHAAGMPAATVLPGGEHAPGAMVVILASAGHVERFLPRVEEAVAEGLIFVDDVALDAEAASSP